MRALPYLLAFALGLGAAGLTACGSKTNKAMLPAENAQELRSHLDDVLSAVLSEDCDEADRALAQVQSDLTSLPSGTSVRLQQRLRDGVQRLQEQAGEECEGETTETQTTTTTETIPTVTTTEPETTPTVPPETTPTVPPETTPTTPTVPPTDETGGAGAEVGD